MTTGALDGDLCELDRGDEHREVVDADQVVVDEEEGEPGDGEGDEETNHREETNNVEDDGQEGKGQDTTEVTDHGLGAELERLVHTERGLVVISMKEKGEHAKKSHQTTGEGTKHGTEGSEAKVEPKQSAKVGALEGGEAISKTKLAVGAEA